MITHSAERLQLKYLGKRVRDMRSKRSMSQEELAELAGVHRTYIGMIERGEKNVTVLSASKIAFALGVTISELFEGCENGQQT